MIPKTRRPQSGQLLKTIQSYLLVGTAVCALASCTATDPEFDQLLGSVKTNPSANAVVGTWYARSSMKQVYANMDSEAVLKIKPDQTAVLDVNNSGRAGIMAVPTSNTTPIKWTYGGNGVWNFSFGSGIARNHGTWRLSGGKLLAETKGSAGIFGTITNRMVYSSTKNAQDLQDEIRRDNTLKVVPYGE